MNASINSILPTAQPYNTTPFNYPGTESVGAIPNGNVVDWVLVELRKPASGLPLDASSSTIIGRKAGFLLKNGTVVDLDGSTPIQFDISKQGAAFVAIRHRNHLGVLSLSIPSNPMGSFANNFSTLGNVYKNPSATSDPATSLPSSVLYGLWSGDVNRSNSVNSLDVNSIKTAISNLVSGYVLQDVNLNGGVNSLDLNQSKATISTLGQSSLLRSNPTRNSSLPD
jgi:hypothetical protein